MLLQIQQHVSCLLAASCCPVTINHAFLFHPARTIIIGLRSWACVLWLERMLCLSVISRVFPIVLQRALRSKKCIQPELSCCALYVNAVGMYLCGNSFPTLHSDFSTLTKYEVKT